MRILHAIVLVAFHVSLPGALGAPALAQWTSQQEARIWPDPNDLAAGDRFGGAIALSGTTLVAGAEWHDPSIGEEDLGAAYVFVVSGSSWTLEAKLGSASLDASDHLGASVAIDGDTAVIGAPQDEAGGAAAAGAAYVFVRQAGVWTEQALLVASDLAVFDQFGTAVAIDGDTIAVGAYFADAGGAAHAGTAYVFVRNGSTWTEQAKLVASGAIAHDRFGLSIGISGDLVVVGAPGRDAGGASGTGAAFVFERRGMGWTQAAELVALDGDAGDGLGSAVAIDSTTIVAGAPSDEGAGGSAGGAVYVFVGSGAAWNQEAKLVYSGATYSDELGDSVAVEGDRLVAGVPYDSEAGLATGAVAFFVRAGGTWSTELAMIGSDCDGGDFLGRSVAISGDLVAGGADWGETPPSEAGTGEAYVFEIVPPPLVRLYCTAKTNSLGCVPSMSWTGFPSASNPTPFTLNCSNVINYKYGLLFYGFAEADVPFQGGTLCVAPPHQRTGLQFSAGDPPPPPDCTGTFTFDMNERIQSGVDRALVAGATVFAQYWSRDPGDPHGTSLSDAVLFEVSP